MSLEGRFTYRTKTVEYFANILLSDYATNAETKSFVDKYDFYLFPVVNPDGKLATKAFPPFKCCLRIPG